jgi:surfactin synthase thioesterase subunit
MEEMAKDAITFVEAMGLDQVDLFGFSMGGMIAQEIVPMNSREISARNAQTGCFARAETAKEKDRCARADAPAFAVRRVSSRGDDFARLHRDSE